MENTEGTEEIDLSINLLEDLGENADTIEDFKSIENINPEETTEEEILTPIEEDEDIEDLESTEDTKEVNTDNKDTDNVSPFVPIVEALGERGNLPSFTKEQLEEIESLDGEDKAEKFISILESNMLEAANSIIEASVKSEISKYNDNPEILDILEHYKRGVPLKTILENKASLEDIADIDEDSILEDDDLAKRILLMDNPEADIDNILDIGKAAKKVLPKLKKKKEDELTTIANKKEEDTKARLKDIEDKNNSLISAVDSLKEFAPGLPVNAVVKKKMKSALFDPVDQITSPDGSVRNVNALQKYVAENNEDFQAKVAYIFTITDGFKNMDKLGKPYESKAVQNLAKQIKGEDKTRHKSNSISVKGNDPLAFIKANANKF